MCEFPSSRPESWTAGAAEDELILQAAVLGILLIEHPGQFTQAELTRLLLANRRSSDRAETVEAAISALVGAGLAHRAGEFIVPSYAALYFDRLSI